MCRYAWHNYRDHFACFDCRKAFKYWQWEECEESWFVRRQRLKMVPREIVCPDCAKPMIDMGLDFKAPRKTAVEQWAILQALAQHGFNFHNCGCGVGFKPPKKLRDVSKWLDDHRHKTDGEKLLARINKTRDRRRARA